MLSDSLSTAEISHRLQVNASKGVTPDEPISGRSGTPRPAAVLLPLFRERSQWNLLFIRRSLNIHDRHSGEVAFPGGRIESGEPDPRDAALREAHEEIGLKSGQVDVLGCLPAYRTSSNYLVTPVVGHVDWPAPLRPDPAEVARIFSMPLDWLADPRNHEVRPWKPPGINGTHRVVFFRQFAGERLWGVSARITLSLIQCLR